MEVSVRHTEKAAAILPVHHLFDKYYRLLSETCLSNGVHVEALHLQHFLLCRP